MPLTNEAIIPLMLEMLSAVLGTLGHYLGRIFFTAAAALAIYFAVKAARNLFNVSLGRARVRKDRPDANLCIGLSRSIRDVDRGSWASLVSCIRLTRGVKIPYCGRRCAWMSAASRELRFVMWLHRMPKERSLRIQPYLCRTADLDDVSIDECFRFHSEAFLPADEGVK